jgi:hypothetical protein
MGPSAQGFLALGLFFGMKHINSSYQSRMNNGGPGGTTNKVYLLTQPIRAGSDNEILLATLSPEGLYEKISAVLKARMDFDDPMNADAFDLNDYIDNDPRGHNFRQQYDAFIAGEAKRAGGAAYSVTLEFTMTYQEGQQDLFQLIVSKVEGEIQGGRRRRRKTRKFKH